MLRHFQSIKVSRLGTESLQTDLKLVEKSENDRELIFEAIKDNILFHNCSVFVMNCVIDPMHKKIFSPGTSIIRQGDVHGEDLYVCVRGECQVTKMEAGEEVLRFTYDRLPQAFGELALLYQAPRAATVRALTEVECWVLHFQDFAKIRKREEARLNEEKLRLMDSHDIFIGLDSKQKILVADSMEVVEWPAGEVMLSQKELSSNTYLIRRGKAIASVKDVDVPLEAGSMFGKLSTLNVSAEICTKSPMSCFVLDAVACASLLGSQQELRIYRSLSKVPLLMSIGQEQLIALTPKFSRVEFAEGAYVIREGEVGDAFYVVESGFFRVQHAGKALPSADLEKGACFGEASLLNGVSNIRTADVVTVQAGVLMQLSKDDFVKHLGHLDDLRIMWRMVALRKTKLLRDLPHDKMVEVAKALSREVLHQGQTVIKQGDIGDKFYIIENGNCEVMSSDGKVLNKMRPGEPFGEAALLTASKRTATVTVVSPQCYLLSLNRGDFYSLLGGLMSQLKAAAAQYMSDSSAMETFDPKEVKWVRPFGAGAYAIVYLGWWRNKLYAIKAINKKHMLEVNQVKEVVKEKHLLGNLDSNFCIKLVSTAQDSRNLYMMMMPLLGGELFTLVAETLGPLPEDKARFYAACTVLGLEYLHSQNILYRDLKLENLLIDSRGYLKIADLGIAKVIHPGEKTYTFKGTPDYMAPEYLTSAGVTHSADWWALGVLLFEINAGYTPFQAGEPMEMFRKITNVQYSCPAAFSPALVNLIEGLLQKRVARRLGSGVTGSLEVKQHDWFKGLDWAALKEMKIPAPWLPDIDFSRFDDIPDIEGHPVAMGARITREEQAYFSDF